MKAVVFSVFLMISAVFSAFAQQDPVLMTIGSEQVTRSEFLAVYNKNNVKDEPVTEESIKEYLELFINYKLKVKEAESLQLDTTTAFKNELAGYRRQLAQPYLSNREVTDHLLQEAYERMQWDIRASHILVKVSANASPEDTLKAFKKMQDIHKKLNANGSNFNDIARKFSEDESAKDRPGKEAGTTLKGNGGDLGYFSVLNLFYEFETKAYNMKVGEISQIIRTPVGYHIIYVTDRKPAIGKLQAAHILVRSVAGKEDSVKNRIDEAYKLVSNGSAFDEIAKQYSDDKGSAAKGGVLPWFGCFRMAPTFISPFYSMKPGDISGPVQTEYGWHIIKLIDRKPIGTFDENKSALKNQISRDKRSFIARDKLVSRLKSEYQFSTNDKALNQIKPELSDSLYTASWLPSEKLKTSTEKVCTIAGVDYKMSEFIDYMTRKQSQIKQGDDKFTFVKTMFNLFTEDIIIEYENTRLEEKYPDFKALMKEYRDGILLFDLMDKNVWSKAVKDTTGLNAFYATISGNYKYGPRTEAAIFTCSSEKDLAVLNKLLKKAPKKGYTPEVISNMINTDTVPTVTYKTLIVEKGVNAMIDNTPAVLNQSSVYRENDQINVVWLRAFRDPEPKPLREVKGLVTAEYQNYLELEWVKQLRAKYTWKVDETVLKSIYSK